MSKEEVVAGIVLLMFALSAFVVYRLLKRKGDL